MDSTYEGLKPAIREGYPRIKAGLDSTYEGLKRVRRQTRTNQDSLTSTYEGLKLEVAPEGVPSTLGLDSTYEGLKPDVLEERFQVTDGFGQYL